MAMGRHSASFRDPSGFIFTDRNTLYRQVNHSYRKEYDRLMASGLYDELVDEGLLLPHEEIKYVGSQTEAYKILKPELIEFISYPYEWSFSQLKDAALHTLKIQKTAMKHGMGLKDASAYNVQFHKGKPIFMDTLSFEIVDKPKPWVAYRQYCQHFLAPLALMSYVDISLSKLLREYIDGIPLELASRLLPRKTNFKFGISTHIHIHSKSQKRYASSPKKEVKERTISANALTGIISSLESSTKKLQWKLSDTEWGEYYTFTNYKDRSLQYKKELVKKHINKVKPNIVWDLGANNGFFSRVASDKKIFTVAFDIDPVAVEANYQMAKDKNEIDITPILMDLTNPSPSMGWAHEERQSLEQRGPADLILALALIHHLAISNNLPLSSVAEYFSKLGRHLTIEFVPKGDSQVDKLLATRKDIFPDYTEEGFEKAFKQYFSVADKKKISGSKRTLYLLKKK